MTVPNLSSEKLVAYVKDMCQLTYLDACYDKWAFPDCSEKVFKVLIWKPDRKVETKEVRDYFYGCGYNGNVGAFLAWVAETSPKGLNVSIPDDVDCTPHPDGGLCSPSYRANDGRRFLGQAYLDMDWERQWSFIAFREINQK